jgi:hypothetical protein
MTAVYYKSKVIDVLDLLGNLPNDRVQKLFNVTTNLESNVFHVAAFRKSVDFFIEIQEKHEDWGLDMKRLLNAKEIHQADVKGVLNYQIQKYGSDEDAELVKECIERLLLDVD